MFRPFKIDIRPIALLCAVLIAVLSPAAIISNAAVAGDENIERLAVKRVQPPYPPLAQKYRIEGIVVVQVTVQRDGKVSKAEFVSGNSLFRAVSLDAAKRWEFKRLEGDTLEGTINFRFKLSE